MKNYTNTDILRVNGNSDNRRLFKHPALALVEILVHMPQVPYSELPTYRLVTLEIPNQNQYVLTAEELPAYWSENTYGRS